MAHECADCTFVASRESIYVSPQRRRDATAKPTFIGNFTMPGYSGHVRFYVLKCDLCDSVLIDNAHGYTDRFWLYFSCRDCGYDENHALIIKIKDKDVYLAEGKEFPSEGYEWLPSPFALLLMLVLLILLFAYLDS